MIRIACWSVRTAAIAVLAPCACAHPEHPEIETSSGGEGQPCMVEALGSTGGPEPAETRAGTYEWRMTPGVATELDVDLGESGFMAAAFEAPGTPLEWDIHSHEEGEVIVHERGEDVSGFLQLTAPAPGLYSFYWRNPGPGDATLCVELRLAGDAGIHRD